MSRLRVRKLQLLLTEQELAVLQRMAKRSGRTMSQEVREKLFHSSKNGTSR